MVHNEDSRVKIPSILHLTRLGYKYLSLKKERWDLETNIFTDIFQEKLAFLNPHLEEDEIIRFIEEVKLSLANEDLGREFYEKLTSQSGTKMLDLENFDNNTLNVVTELPYKNGEDNFRPDIILLVNGLPLVFIEVKKPNNREGVIAERNRIATRFQNKKFRRFVNITQLMVFSNNMEYDPEDMEPIQGAFYASPSYSRPVFNYFREKETLDLGELLEPEDDRIEDQVLKDNNLVIIKHSPEFITNKNPDSPTNRVSTSLFSKERLKFLLKYAVAYVEESNGMQKHIMRYPQLFATKAIEQKLDSGIQKGIIWHTQGSGKTALAYYSTRFLTDYYQERNTIPKFYFIVDRLDLLLQAKAEFTSRGLVVHIVNSKDDFVKDIKRKAALHNDRGELEITVVNIQKFSQESRIVQAWDYDVDVQRVYFLDEVHRSYNPEGSFLANLENSDKKAIKIGLTGTPLLGTDYNSKSLFGDYIHKYYYNASIADGYTLRLIREEIESNYKVELERVLKEIELKQGDVERRKVFADASFVEPFLDYIIDDFEKFRRLNDDSIGGMIVCDSSDQAKMLFEIFQSKYGEREDRAEDYNQAAEPMTIYRSTSQDSSKVKTAALILHDVGTKEERKLLVEDFKDGKIDFLIVYNMLLTGFDAKRLKKLYLGRVIKRHNLLQTLTRVNRRYKDFRYGYIVDFADIRAEFARTNKDYYDELQQELGDEMQHYSDIFKSKEEILKDIEKIEDTLFYFDTKNSEVFSQQISQITDRKTMIDMVKALANAKSLHNLIRLFGHKELQEKLDFYKLNDLYREANNHLMLLNQKEAVENHIDTTNLLNIALEDVVFRFRKNGEEELILADKLENTLRQTREALVDNFDKKDPKFVSLYEELERLFKKKKLNEVSQVDMRNNIGSLRSIHEKIKELNRQNDLLKQKYDNDPKYCRIHKRLMGNEKLSQSERKIFNVLRQIKEGADLQIIQNSRLLENESYLDRMMIKLVVNKFVKENNIPLNAETSKFINNLVVREYINEFQGYTA